MKGAAVQFSAARLLRLPPPSLHPASYDQNHGCRQVPLSAGHTHALCGVSVVPGTPQILSADAGSHRYMHAGHACMHD